MSPFLEKLEENFVWRRAFRSPGRCVVRSDLVEAFGMSGNKASALLTHEAGRSGGLLMRQGNKVLAPEWAKAPHWADEVDLMSHLQRGLTDYEFTGLLPSEAPINRVVWSESLPCELGAMERITKALVQRGSIYIFYVSMKAGDTGKWRRIAPVGFDCMGEQWRVVAQDLESKNEIFPIRTFVLARILETKTDSSNLPKGFIKASGNDSKAIVHVKLSDRLTENQRKVMTHEFNIKRDGAITLPRRSAFEFFIQFGGKNVSEDVIWPPLKEVREDKDSSGKS